MRISDWSSDVCSSDLEGWQTMALLECARRHTEDMLGTTVEIGEHAIAIEEELHQPNLDGMIRIGTGATSGRQPRAAITALLCTALRPRLRARDHATWAVMPSGPTVWPGTRTHISCRPRR